ncbi:quinone oxidoreductase family protein [Elizabethkingia anophelis]|uniref:quinone oxidoreductase family protein n=1 Tax=Elizabethkingia anophelis TaxID=1117645 RepID=UPI0004E374D3|nr:alcohol dehydrogenase catalytic domain-containing protein [Elizabethkingia anophelis]AQW93511.1 alanine dehydrogenase [Elizabethkingia anophelis]KFC33264.1 alanine dehydrogenase [Elizabethkingia anophelis]MCT3786844.1 alcohol dehydrogenase catalytic domain-containing protein [Elizabethkingia anophelis]MCT4295879.1 alcohol dehydrogenase catalytic domain-containing protein [Elizabethkingia anophelis]MCT4299629.1 alcohol dehydrogenase catalytic domain-containing protein [Elizabethkingia anophe
MYAVKLVSFQGENQLINDLEYTKPEIKKNNQVLVKVKAVAVNPIDLQMFQGKNEKRIMSSDILGRELAGVIEETGSNVKHFKKGDEVFLAVGSMGSNGAFAEYVVVSEEILAHKPKELSFERITALPIAYVTAWQAVSRLQLSKESSLLILGASGSVGKALINVLHHFGYQKIIATAGNDYNISELIKQGLLKEQIVSYKQPDLDRIILTQNNGLYDIVIDCIGGKMTETGANSLKREGLFVDITNLRTEEANYTLFQKAAIIMNIARYAEPELHFKYGKILNEVSSVLGSEENWHLQEVLNLGKLSAENLTKAFNLMEENKTNGKKLVLKAE